MLVRGSLNGLLGEICGAATEYCLISCLVCVSASTAAQEAALLCYKKDAIILMKKRATENNKGKHLLKNFKQIL